MTTFKDFHSSDCHEIVSRLWPHLDGALPDSHRAAIIAHLESCGACRSHFEFAQAFLAAVASARPSSGATDDALRRRVLTALAGEGFQA